MRILIDTNIIIPLEDTCGVLCGAYSELAKVATENSHQLIVHPGSLDDLRRDKNDSRKQTLLSKALKYPILESPPTPSVEKLEELALAEKKDNDRVDNLILYAILKSAAHILVTEDRGIHNKAKQLGISDRVHYVLQTVNFLKELHRIVEVRLPDVSHLPLHNIDCDDSFFDSLRGNYAEFDTWYASSSAQGRKAWCVYDQDSLAAILIYKEEFDEHVAKNTVLTGKCLKLCTFKVGESMRGRKIGELMIKMAFEHAISNLHSNVYVTIRPGIHDHLRDLCEDFGFSSIGMCKNNRDEVFVKEIPHTAPYTQGFQPLDFHKKYYPFFVCSNVKKYVVPIIPDYHWILFPEVQQRHHLALFSDTSPAGNTIKKAYLCHAQLKSMDAGDILLFYRSTDSMSITTIGIVERFEKLSDADEVATLVSKRTVYSKNEIEDMCEKETKVILFRQIKHFEIPIPRNWLQKNGVPGNIQSIRSIDDATFQKIMQKGGVQNCA